MLWLIIALIVVVLAVVLTRGARKAKSAEDETSYMPGGGPKPTIGNAQYRRVRRDTTTESGTSSPSSS